MINYTIKQIHVPIFNSYSFALYFINNKPVPSIIVTNAGTLASWWMNVTHANIFYILNRSIKKNSILIRLLLRWSSQKNIMSINAMKGKK